MGRRKDAANRSMMLILGMIEGLDDGLGAGVGGEGGMAVRREASRLGMDELQIMVAHTRHSCRIVDNPGVNAHTLG